MKLNSQDLEKITDLTLDYYNRHAEDFWEGTRNHDVSQNIAAMLCPSSKFLRQRAVQIKGGAGSSV
jgi:hypothetical protein